MSNSIVSPRTPGESDFSEGEEDEPEDEEAEENEDDKYNASDDDEGDVELDLSINLAQFHSNISKCKQQDEEAFARLIEWERFAASMQPDDQTRHEMILMKNCTWRTNLDGL